MAAEEYSLGQYLSSPPLPFTLTSTPAQPDFASHYVRNSRSVMVRAKEWDDMSF